MKKVAVIMLILVILVVGITLILRTCDTNKLPGIDQARWSIYTGNRYYLTREYTQGKNDFGNYILLKGYWTSIDGQSWTYSKEEIKLYERSGKPVIKER